jgi:hypothetical protein
MIDQAARFATRLEREAGPKPHAQIDRAFQLAFNRYPDATELVVAEKLIGIHGLPTFCRSVLNANEMMFVP